MSKIKEEIKKKEAKLEKKRMVKLDADRRERVKIAREKRESK
jgi:hypothetical protein